MVNRRICIYLIGISLLVGCLTGCGKKENIELAEDVFLTISSTAKGEGVETYEMYTLHADISQNGQVRIYADNFNRWISENPCPEKNIQLSADVIQEIKDRIDESDLYHMRKNIGNRDLKEGEYKELTLYTTEGIHVSGGMNPSYREFRNIYDYIDDQLRETIYLYRAQIAQMQKQGLVAEKNKNIYITDMQEQTIVPEEDINDVYVTYGAKHERFDVDATPDALPETNYYVTLLLADAGKDVMRKDTEQCMADNPSYYKIYQNNAYLFTFTVQEQALADELYIYETTDAESAVQMAQKMRNSLY